MDKVKLSQTVGKGGEANDEPRDNRSLLTAREYLKLIGFIPVLEHDLRKVSKAQDAKTALIRQHIPEDKNRLLTPEETFGAIYGYDCPPKENEQITDFIPGDWEKMNKAQDAKTTRYLVLKPPEDKVTAVEKIRDEVELAVLNFAHDYHRYKKFREDIAFKGIKSHPKFITKICQLFPAKVKLPEIPYIDEYEYGRARAYDFRWGASVALQQVKDALKKAGVEVEE